VILDPPRVPGDRSASAPPEISLILSTRDRADRLESTLDRLRYLAFDGEWEVVVVDNGSTDHTPEVLVRAARIFGDRIVRVAEPAPGLGRAHNRGLERARGWIVALIDDDCLPAPDYLRQLHDCFREEPRLGYLGGRILLQDSADLPIAIQPSTRRREFPPSSAPAPGLLQGANLAFRRTALEEVGGFDPMLGPGTPFNCEDVDIAARISAAGWLGAYDPRPLVRHHHGRRSGAELAALLRSYDHGRGAYFVKCLLNPRLRSAARRQWLSSRPWRSPRRSFREINGGIHYLLALARRAGESPGPLGQAPRLHR